MCLPTPASSLTFHVLGIYRDIVYTLFDGWIKSCDKYCALDGNHQSDTEASPIARRDHKDEIEGHDVNVKNNIFTSINGYVHFCRY